jgi:hypothetical protein
MISAFRQANENPSVLKPYRAAGCRAQIMGNSQQGRSRAAAGTSSSRRHEHVSITVAGSVQTSWYAPCQALSQSA